MRGRRRPMPVIALLVACLVAPALSCRREPQLLKAARKGQVSRLQSLLGAGADVNQRSAQGETALHVAARADGLETARVLVQHGADLEAAAPGGYTPLHLAAGAEHTAVTRLLLESGADTEARDDTRRTPLSGAAETGHGKVVELLLAAGADPNARDFKGMGPLERAALVSQTDVVWQLLEAGAMLVVPDDLTAAALLEEPLVLVAPDAVYLLLRLDAPRMIFAAAGLAETRVLARMLDEQPALVYAMDGRGMTPLHHAAERGRVGAVRLLLKRGADVSCPDQAGRLPVVGAVLGKSPAAVGTLVRAQGGLHWQDDEGKTLLHYAAAWANASVVSVLLRAGLKADVLDGRGRTPLSAATDPEIARVLLENGADPNRRSGPYTMLEFAEANGRHELAKVLREYGAR